MMTIDNWTSYICRICDHCDQARIIETVSPKEVAITCPAGHNYGVCYQDGGMYWSKKWQPAPPGAMGLKDKIKDLAGLYCKRMPRDHISL